MPPVHIPCRGGGPVLADTIAGRLSLSLPALSMTQPQVRAGEPRVLGAPASGLPGVASEDRSQSTLAVGTKHNSSGLTGGRWPVPVVRKT